MYFIDDYQHFFKIFNKKIILMFFLIMSLFDNYFRNLFCYNKKKN